MSGSGTRFDLEMLVMPAVVQDLRYGLRVLARSPGLTATAVLSLALGIGVNTSIFSVVNAVLLKPLPYPDSDRLLNVHQTWAEKPGERDVLSSADVAFLQEGAQALGRVAGYFAPAGGFVLTNTAPPGAGASATFEPEQARGTAVTAELFDLLGVPPARGRSFLPADGRAGAEPVVMLSDALWKRRFGGDPAVIGRAVIVDGRSLTIVGVMPPGFRFPRDRIADLWTIFRPEVSDSRPPYFVSAVARPRPGASAADIARELETITTRIKDRFPDAPSSWALGTAPLKDVLVGDVGPSLLMLLGAVALVLLIATANIANLLLARATARRKEMAIRAVLGAGRARLARQLVTESLLLAGVGGSLGVVLSLWGTDLLVRLGPRDLPRLSEIGIDLRVLGYTALVTILSGVLFGLAPAIQASRSRLAPVLHDGDRGSTDLTGRWLRSLLVVSEFALAVMLLVGAGLLIRNFLRLQRVDPGFEPEGLLTASISLPQARYGEEAARSAFFRELVERVEHLPGVQGAAVSMALPPNLLVMTNPYTVEGRPLVPGRNAPAIPHLLVSPGYFRALGVPLLRGRMFTEADAAGAPPVVVINRTMAASVFAGTDPIGKRIQFGDPDPRSPWVTIVGVVGDVKYSGLAAAPEPTMYTPYEQSLWWPSMYLVVRAGVEPSSLAQAVRAQVAAIDPLLPVARVHTMRELLGLSVAGLRFRTTLLGLFAAAALLLATLGVYGILSYSVEQRRREIGIRMAIGAKRRDVLGMVVGQGMRLALTGLAIGVALALAACRALSGLLFGAQMPDPATLLGVGLIFLAVAAAASVIPAQRAMRVDPMTALRGE